MRQNLPDSMKNSRGLQPILALHPFEIRSVVYPVSCDKIKESKEMTVEHLCLCKLGSFLPANTMSIKNPEENLPRNASKVFLDVHSILVGLIKGLWVVSSLCHKGVSNANAFELYCLCCPILKPGPVVLTGDRACGWNIMGESVEIAGSPKWGT